MMKILRYALFALLLVLSVLVLRAWDDQFGGENHPKSPISQTIGDDTTTSEAPGNTTLAGYVPAAYPSSESIEHDKHTQNHIKHAVTASVASVDNQDWLWVTTDVLRVAIDKKTGNVVTSQLLQFPQSLSDKSVPVTLFEQKPGFNYTAQSGLTTKKGLVSTPFQAEKSSYSMGSNQNKLIVTLKGRSNKGLAVERQFTFHRGHYAIDLKTTLQNESKTTWVGSFFAQLLRQPPEQNHGHLFMMRPYLGASISSPDTPYQKLPFTKLQKKPVNQTTPGGWVAMQQHYFLSAWIPTQRSEMHHYYSHYSAVSQSGRPEYVIGFLTPEMTVAPGKTTSQSATLYVGPESLDHLKPLAPGLDHTLDYGFLWPISISIQWLMKEIVHFMPNWGLAIILATIIIKTLFYWLSSKSFLSMARMRELQPRLKSLKDRYGEDRMGLQKATMALYKEHNVSPMGGCLPMLIQIPVFIALYYVITQSIYFRQAPFILWIHDLSIADPYYIIVVIMMGTMALQQYLSPSSSEMQQKMIWVMPIVFGFMFRNFPAGLVLYWCINNLTQSFQQWFVLKRYKAGKYKKPAKRKTSKAHS